MRTRKQVGFAPACGAALLAYCFATSGLVLFVSGLPAWASVDFGLDLASRELLSSLEEPFHAIMVADALAAVWCWLRTWDPDRGRQGRITAWFELAVLLAHQWLFLSLSRLALPPLPLVRVP